MAEPTGTRSAMATVVGWILVVIIGLVVARWVLGSILWLFRWALILVVIGALLTLYLRLKLPKD
jgi:hypothetical protein